VSDVASHAGARPRVEAGATLVVADGAKPRRLLVAREVAKAETLVVRAVPRHVERTS
jgi:hypothetical protein